MPRHPNQGPKARHTAELTDVDVAAIVNEQGFGLVTLITTGSSDKARHQLVGQLTPAVAFALAENLRRGAESALGDQVLYAVARNIAEAQPEEGTDVAELAKRIAGDFITEARRQRLALEGTITTTTDDVEAELLDEEAGDSDSTLEAVPDLDTEEAST